MIDREVDHVAQDKLTAKRGEDVVATPREAPAVIAPQKPRDNSRFVPNAVEKDQGPPRHTTQLAQHPSPGRFGKVMGNESAQREVETACRKRELGRISHHSNRRRMLPPHGHDRNRIDVERNRIETELPRQASARAADVKNERRRCFRENRFHLFDHDRTAPRLLDELVKPWPGDQSGCKSLEKCFAHGRTSRPSVTCRRKIDPRRSDSTGR